MRGDGLGVRAGNLRIEMQTEGVGSPVPHALRAKLLQETDEQVHLAP